MKTVLTTRSKAYHSLSLYCVRFLGKGEGVQGGPRFSLRFVFSLFYQPTNCSWNYNFIPHDYDAPQLRI